MSELREAMDGYEVVKPDYEAAYQKMKDLMPYDWEREPWPQAFSTLIVEAAIGDAMLVRELPVSDGGSET